MIPQRQEASSFFPGIAINCMNIWCNREIGGSDRILGFLLKRNATATEKRDNRDPRSMGRESRSGVRPDPRDRG